MPLPIQERSVEITEGNDAVSYTVGEIGTDDESHTFVINVVVREDHEGFVTFKVEALPVDEGNFEIDPVKYKVQVDTLHPSVESIVVLENFHDGKLSFDATITFSEAVSNFEQADVSLTGTATATITAWNTTDDTTFTATITPTTSGTVIIDVPADIATDAGNNSNTAAVAQTVTVDIDAPSVSVSAPSGVQRGAFDATITFSEVVSGFEQADVSLTGTATATITAWNTTDDTTFTATITPTTSGTVIIDVPADVATDTATNGNTAAVAQTVTVDIDAPSVSVSAPSGVQRGAFDATITFSEVVSGFEQADVSLTGTATATITAWNTTDDTTFTATITPTTSGTVIIDVPADIATDAGNNSNTAAVAQTVTVDIDAPSVSVSVLLSGVQRGAFDATITFSEVVSDFEQTFEVRITFTESVTGFVASDISLTGTATATVTVPLTGSGADYTAEITPTADGDLVIQVPADVAVDEAGNGNTASQSDTVSIDLSRPTVEITYVPTQTQTGWFEVTITFSEDVTGFEADDISLSATASATVSGSGTVYTAKITPAADAEGEVTFNVRENVAKDGVGKGNTASRSYTVPVDLVRPSVDISGVPTQVTMATFEVTITFSEDVTDLIADDILLSATAFATLSGSGAVYTVTITLEGEIAEALIIRVPENVAHDAADNGNTASIEHRIEAWMPDANLRDIVRDVLGLPVDAIFTKEALLDLTVLDTTEIILDAEDPRIADLTGLEYATELTELYLNEQAIRDLRPLATLSQLTQLSLNNNVIESLFFEDSDGESINPFADLTELTELSLDGNLIEDIAALEPLTHLTELSLNGNAIEDITALEALTHLTTLSLNGNAIEDITTLEALTQLTALSLNENPIDDLSPLEGLTELTELSLNDNSIDDVFFCTALTQLQILCLEDNEISDVSPLTGLPHLEQLKLNGNPIDDTAPLIGIGRRIEADEPIASLISDEVLAEVLREAFDMDTDEHITYTDLRSLTTFEAPDGDITDLGGMEHATELETLDFRGNTIEDITPLKGLTKLTTLDLRNNAITDVTPLSALVKLETLRLTGNPIEDASPLVDLTADIEADIVVPGVIADPTLAAAIQETLDLPTHTRIVAETLQDLESLNVQEGEINTLAGLEHATHLTTLRINAGSVTDVTPLQALTHLTTLEINSDAIANLTPLQALTHLTTLKINGGSIIDITSLQTLTHLTILELRDNTIIDITTLSGLTALTTLDLSGNSITNIASLQELTGLTTLDLADNGLSNIDGLQSLTALTTLDLSDNSISSLTSLQALTALKTLDLADNGLSNIDGLQSLTALTTLDLSDNSISSLTSLQALTALKTLDLADNGLSNIDGLQSLTKLTTLGLSANNLIDIQSLQGLIALRQLYLVSNDITDVSSLAGLVNLELLRLAENPILDTSPLFSLVTVHKLVDVDIEISQWAPWDVNQDGIVNDTDSTLVTAAIGQTDETLVDPLTDVNGDGVVDRDDLLLVQEHLNIDVAGSPSIDTIVALLGSSTLKSLNRAMLEAELNHLIAESDGSLKYQRAIEFLQNFLVLLRPDKTRLLANYPNPFNPETWIPYQLATAGDVHLIIYDVRGTLVRQLALGLQQAGYYVEKARAAYWDGRNLVGERVASGIYFYELRANNISVVRKMLILK